MSKKKEREPQWYMSEVGVPVYNYHVYHMKKVEKIIYILLAFVVGAVVAYLVVLVKMNWGEQLLLLMFSM